MSYRFYAEHIKPIGSKEGSAGNDTVIPVSGCEGLRLTIPRLSVSCGATPQVLTVLQVEDMDQISAFDTGGKTLTFDTIETDLADKHIAVEKEDGTFFFTTVTSSAAKVHTLTDAPPADTKIAGNVYIFCDTDSELVQTEALAANTENNLEAPAPGRFIARDFCFPLIIHITNTTNPTTVRGGAAVYISR
ncbi:MAG: hypothetical protein PQJ61_00395 [Spirochaetales bacterium]|uniref:Uncharacterized protein n=1 Tax=Candidatus Thalassospirochaeta sargassi TaxID=3119039 RepID=A0AAJ1I9L1_9SPIO|nr:hypothetical protein [Spirochaetales bacterium]